ncbi:MAG TPA: hypothetical protein VEC56_05560 [Candidatus Krumholzibacteria bacterium]|nr:hypothetical protein [Candidatus Krumholzibacteria bacterium]
MAMMGSRSFLEFHYRPVFESVLGKEFPYKSRATAAVRSLRCNSIGCATVAARRPEPGSAGGDSLAGNADSLSGWVVVLSLMTEERHEKREADAEVRLFLRGRPHGVIRKMEARPSITLSNLEMCPAGIADGDTALRAGSDEGRPGRDTGGVGGCRRLVPVQAAGVPRFVEDANEAPVVNWYARPASHRERITLKKQNG